MTEVNTKKSRMTVKSEFKESTDRREDRLIAKIDRKTARERPNRDSERVIRTYRGNQYRKDYNNER